MLDDWCTNCNTRHSGKEICPGPLSPTGPERNGWKVSVKTNRGPEDYGVLISPAGKYWLARILTFPNERWTTPGTRHAMNFIGESPQVAEQQAIHHIKEHIQNRNLTLLSGRPPGEATATDVSVEKEQDDPSVRRKICSVPVMFGHNAHTLRASVENVSERGMFINTGTPLRTGTVIRVKMQLDSCIMPLRGMVVWTRVGKAEGRPSGMGVRLFKPPALYVSYVRMI